MIAIHVDTIKFSFHVGPLFTLPDNRDGTMAALRRSEEVGKQESGDIEQICDETHLRRGSERGSSALDRVKVRLKVSFTPCADHGHRSPAMD